MAGTDCDALVQVFLGPRPSVTSVDAEAPAVTGAADPLAGGSRPFDRMTIVVDPPTLITLEGRRPGHWYVL